MAEVGSLWETVARRARQTPGQPLIVEADGTSYSYATAHALSLRWADVLRAGQPGEQGRVAVILPNQGAAYLLRLACGYAGLVFVAVNPLLRGKSLADALLRSSVTDVVVSRETLGAFAGIRDQVPGSLLIHLLDGDCLRAAPASPVAEPSAAQPAHPAPVSAGAPPEHPASEPDPDRTFSIVYTSGTSGPAKPVRLSASALQQYARNLFGDAGRDWPPGAGYYSPWHQAHILGAVALDVAVSRRLVLVLRRKFAVGHLWPDVCRHDCRLTVLVAVTADVWAQRQAAQADNPLEVVGMAPLIPAVREFERYYGVESVSIYGMTELGTVLTARSPADSGMTGRPVGGYECRLARVPGIETASGSLGELLVRPSARTSEYDPAGGPASGGWSNGWFHTGDLFREAGGSYSFVGRIKDSIRRHGRNISAVDLEDELRALDVISDCACVGFSPQGQFGPASEDEEIRLFVVARPAATLDPAALADHLAGRLPAFMVPRYIDVVDDLPRTLNGKLSRQALRRTPIGPRTYDRKRVLASASSVS